MGRRTVSRIGTLIVIGLLIWRVAGMPGLGRDDGAGGLAASGLVAQELEAAANQLRGLSGVGSRPGIHRVEPAATAAAPSPGSGPGQTTPESNAMPMVVRGR